MEQLQFKEGWSLSQLRVLIWDHVLMGFIGILQVPMADCLVGARLVCGLVVWAGWLGCPCHVLGWVEHWRGSCEGDELDRDFRWIPNALQFGTTVFLLGLETLHGLSFAPFGCGTWQGWFGRAAPAACLLNRLGDCQVISWGDRKSFDEPHSTCLVRAMWPDWQCGHVSGGSCTFCYFCYDLL